MTIRNALLSEFEAIQKIYMRARQYMKETGNPDQWTDKDPTDQAILADIENGTLYVIEEDGILLAVFAFIPGIDPTYNYIDGSWLDDLPYCAIHRVASAGIKKGMLPIIMDYAFTKTDCIKIDTHRDNLIMQHQLKKYGFSYCGIIYLENGDPRLAYQLRKKQKSN